MKPAPLNDSSTGIDVLRSDCYARRYAGNGGVQSIAREAGISFTDVEAFIDGKSTPPMPALQAMAKFLHDAKLDPETKLLSKPPPPERSIGNPRPRWKSTNPLFEQLWEQSQPKPAKPKPPTEQQLKTARAWTRRPGWAT